MIRKRWNIAVLTVVLLLSFGFCCVTAYANMPNQNNSITVFVDGNTVTFEHEPIIVNDRIMTPVHPITEALGWSADVTQYGIYLKQTGDLQITPGQRYYTYYQSTIGLSEEELYINRGNTIGSIDFHHFNNGHFPMHDGERCPGERMCWYLEEEKPKSWLHAKPELINEVLYVAVRDLADAMYATISWDSETQVLSIFSQPLPYYDGEGLPEEYRNWLYQRTFNPFGTNGSFDNQPTLSEHELTTQLTAEVLRLVNEIRTQEGLLQLQTDSLLNAVVQIRAAEIKEKFSHTRPNNGPASSAYADTPYFYSGENILLVMAGRNPQSAALLIVDMWMNSDGHKRNILNPDNRYMGVGAVRGENNKLYCVQGFLRE